MVDQVTDCVGINVLGRYCDEVFICDAFHFTKFVVKIPKVCVVGAWRWHGVGQLLLIVEPVAIMALEVRSKASLRSWGLCSPWFENYTGKQAEKRSWQHYALSFARDKDTFTSFEVLNQRVLHPQNMTNCRFQLAAKVFLLLPH